VTGLRRQRDPLWVMSPAVVVRLRGDECEVGPAIVG